MSSISDSRVANVDAGRYASWVAAAARRLNIARRRLSASALLLVACCIFIVLFALQILFVGGMDVLGLAPQVSFLCLNIALIVLFSSLAFHPALLKLWRARRQAPAASRTAETVGEAFRTNTSVTARSICKVLVIRRKAVEAGEATRETRRNFERASKRREVGFNA